MLLSISSTTPEKSSGSKSRYQTKEQDIECKKENEINNNLNIVSNGTHKQQQEEPRTCEEYFTTINSVNLLF